ncbi:hypothetical protein F7207_07285 [Helicobacter pylori]|uniref:hypothetical protein n=1 Tax=Helicobacter pylori TaxID=210 RepID=UPI0012E76D07|nr:hypothetical protein [Helicobacter pylori]MUU54735.1 hypothetical protein [Helicobacter pylori]
MRHEHETATSFNQLKEITQIMQAQNRSAQNSANANASEITHQANANASEITHQSTLTPKIEARDKKGALKPTKRAFSERQKTAYKGEETLYLNYYDKTNKRFRVSLKKATEAKGGKNEA